jgi:hypothetical protein
MSAVSENHVSDSRSASVWAILPAGVGENDKVGERDPVSAAYFVDWIVCPVWVEF